MNTKIAVFLFTFLAFLTVHVADAQRPGKVPKIGYLSQFSGVGGPQSPQMTGFLIGMRELGYVDGKNIAIEYRYTEGKSERLPELAAELASLKVDIIVTETGGGGSLCEKGNSDNPYRDAG